MLSFCINCKNLLYLKITDSEQVHYYCRYCGHIEEIKDKGVIVAYKKTIESANDWRRFINEYTKFDPTLPRTTEIECPNDKCCTDTKDCKEVIKIRYDDDAMKFAYLCPLCDASWITN